MLLVLSLLAAACGTRLDNRGISAAESFAPGDDQEATLSGQASGGPRTAETQTTSGGNAGGASTAPSATGGGGGSTVPASADGPASAASNEPVAPRGTITIGFTGPLSGPIGFLGEELVAIIDAGFKLANEQGGDNGWKYRLVSYDDRYDPTLALANVRRLVEQDKATVVFEAFVDSTAQYATQTGTPLVTWGLTAIPFSSKYPTVIPMLGNLLVWNHQSWGAALQAMGIPIPKRVAILYDNYLFDSKPYLDYLKDTWERLGSEVVSMDALSIKDGDCTNVALKMRQLDVDFWAFDGSGFILCVPAAQRIGWKPSGGWGGWPVSHTDFLTPLGDYADGMIRAGTGDRADGKPGWNGDLGVYPELAEFQDAMKRFRPRHANSATYDSPSVNYWAGVRLIREAVRNCDDGSKECLLRYIHGLRNWTGGGITPPVLSCAPDCKTGSYKTFWGRWNARDKVFEPATGYLADPFFDEFGGACGITKLADQRVGG